jgi:hypothetical protein
VLCGVLFVCVCVCGVWCCVVCYELCVCGVCCVVCAAVLCVLQISDLCVLLAGPIRSDACHTAEYFEFLFS